MHSALIERVGLGPWPWVAPAFHPAIDFPRLHTEFGLTLPFPFPFPCLFLLYSLVASVSSPLRLSVSYGSWPITNGHFVVVELSSGRGSQFSTPGVWELASSGPGPRRKASSDAIPVITTTSIFVKSRFSLSALYVAPCHVVPFRFPAL